MLFIRCIILLLLLLVPSLVFPTESVPPGEAVSSSSPLTVEQPLAEQQKMVVPPASNEVQYYQIPKVEQHRAEPQSRTKEPTVVSPPPQNHVGEKAVDKSLSLFTERIRERVTLWLSRSSKYLEMMKEILRSKNVPEDIAFLPMIESGFNPAAYSVAKAVGPWQFIASTAKRYGLKIDWWRDERRDPVKSTEAAANYLADLYEMFGSWNLAMAAYNAGEGKILKALNLSRSDNYWDLLNTRYIKNETKQYVPHFIAAKMIADDPHSFGFHDVNYHPPLAFDEVTLSGPIDLEVAAQCAETSIEGIKDLNPELRRWCTPINAPSYTLRIPAGTKELFVENLSRIPEEERFSVMTYTAKKGDTVKKISSKTGVPVNVILEFNDDRMLKSLKAGDTVYLPPKGKASPDAIDKMEARKASSKTKTAKTTQTTKTKKKKSKKIVVASLNKKDTYSD